MKIAKIYFFAFLAMFMLSFSLACAQYVKVTAEDGTVSWIEIDGTINGSSIEIYGGEYNPAIDYETKGSIDLNEVWSRSGGRGTHYQVTSIGGWAFSSCSGLTSIAIPSSVGWIGCRAFSECNNLQKVNIDDLAAWCNIYFDYGDDQGGSPFTFSNPLFYAKHLYLNDKLVTNLEIPNGVTKIEWFTFINAVDIKSVIIPNTVTSIEREAFSGCSGLTSITIPSSVTAIYDFAFSDCSGLTSITIPSGLTYIGDYAFYDCSNLQEVEINAQYIGTCFSGLPSIQKITLGEQVTKIEEGAFSGCSGLTSITIPSSVTSIGSSAFSGCSSLTSITIPSSVTSWDNAFYNCSGLTTVTIEEGVLGIGNTTFKNCSSLSSITIPSSVTSIGSSAFQGCTNLKDVTSEITDVFVTGTDAFKGCENATLHVPAGTYVAYSGRADWNRIIHIEEAGEGSQMTLACNTKGSVLVNGKTTFTNKIKDVEVNEEEENTFEFIPNEGCRLEQVTLNGLDVTLSVSNNKLTTVIPAKSQMMVVFSKGNDINGDGNVDISDVVSLVNLILGQ